MFKNYFKVALRNILKYKVFSFINVFGLAIAMSVCMLIILMLADQSRYDDFHDKKERIYRILSNGDGFRQPYATSPDPLAETLVLDYPVIEDAVNLTPGFGGDAVYQQQMAEVRGYFTDASFFRVFSFELDKGDQATALDQPNSLVLSSAVASRLFKGEDPIGKVVEFSDRQLSFPQRHDGVGSPAVPWGSFTVTGVIDESKYISHIKFDVLVSSSSRPALYAQKKLEDRSNSWDWYFRSYTFALLKEGEEEQGLSVALNDLVRHKYESIKSEQVKGFHLVPQKLSDIQLGLVGNDTDNRLPMIGYYFLFALAVVIMMTACLNYTNLSVARSLTRAREIGVRKVSGAARRSLVIQFLCESVVTALLALGMAVALLALIKPAFKHLWINQYLNFELPSSVSVYLLFTGFALIIGILAGAYPAFYLSGYHPVKVLKGLTGTPGKMGLRKVLSVSQFVISLFFITTSILVFKQFQHFMTFDYGFTSSNVVNIELQGVDNQKLANELSAVPGVSAISATDIIPATGRSNGIEVRKGGEEGEYTQAWVMCTNENFVSNLDLRLLAGRDLPKAGELSDRYVLVNASAAEKLGYKYPAEIVGQVLETKWGNEPLEVIGVVEDFRYKLLINSGDIGPLVLRNLPQNFQYLNVKVVSSDLMKTVRALESKWKKVDPLHPFRYEFFDEQLAGTQQGILDLVSILSFIALLAIVIACLGLLGMATYTSERRAKEVGIRKILGAHEQSIALLLSLEFFKILMLAIAIGTPLSYFANGLWLQLLPNRVELGAGTLLTGILVMLMLGMLTIGSQTWRAAKANPADALKTD